MLRKDYILRQLEEFGKVMAVILGFKKQNDWTNFEKEIKNAAVKFTSLEINTVENLNEPDFEKQILNHPNLIQDQKKILADLLFEKLNFYAEKNEEEKYLSLKTKCFKLYQHIQNNHTDNEFDMNVHYKLEILKKQN
ncbi:MAG: hypothetical protein Q7W45_03255 [Bacteroidota bacterium]|nr:hypothetical protein [Bacteroidota bacterium]MDP3145728.1 hypothetical protein [Bacteroidota bacterium]